MTNGTGPFYGDPLMRYERLAGAPGQSVILTVTHGNPDPSRSLRDLAGRVDGTTRSTGTGGFSPASNPKGGYSRLRQS